MHLTGSILGTPTFSQDGRWLAVFVNRTLKKIPVSGGTPVTLCEVAEPFGASWGPDNVILIGQGPRGIQRVFGDGGEPVTVATVNPGEAAHGPQMLPDGDHVLFTLAADGVGEERWDKAQIVVQSLKSGVREVVIQNGTDARYLPSSGRLVYAYGSTLWTVPFDVARLEVRGKPELIVEGVRRAGLDGLTGAAQFAASDTGTLAYIPGAAPSTYRSLALFDANGNTTVLDVMPGLHYNPRFSADGQQIAWQAGDGNIWIYDRRTAAKRPLTFDGKSGVPVWTPDGRLVFQSASEGGPGLFWQSADGSSGRERLTTDDPGFTDIPTSVSRDGQILLFIRAPNSLSQEVTRNAGRAGIWTLPLAGERKPRLLIEAKRGEAPYSAAVFSPDGRWILYQWGSIRRAYVEPFPPTGARYPVTTDRSFSPTWLPDGNRIVYLTGPDRRFFRVVEILRKEPSLQFGPPMPMFAVKDPINTFGDGGRIADMSPDGRYVVAIQASDTEAEQTSSQLEVVLNWYAAPNLRAPTK